MKIFIVLSESPLKVRKMSVYCFLMSFLAPELLTFKDLKNDQKMVQGAAGFWIKSMKIDKK